jgi:hypothetical protein
LRYMCTERLCSSIVLCDHLDTHSLAVTHMLLARKNRCSPRYDLVKLQSLACGTKVGGDYVKAKLEGRLMLFRARK